MTRTGIVLNDNVVIRTGIVQGEVGAYPHTEACPHTLLFVHRVTSGLWNHAKRHCLTSKSTTCIYFLIEVNK